MDKHNQIDWCLNKALAALEDYDAATATAYVKMAKIWNDKLDRSDKLTKVEEILKGVDSE